MPTPNEQTNLQCPRCGAALTDAALSGLCPQCLVKITFGEEAEATRVVTPGDATPQSLLPATVRYFGDYELLDELARGGMGVVYRARQVSLNRVVAVKMILAGQFANDAEVKRFRAEAESAAKLQHPNIVAIHEVGEHQGRHYFSMDLVNGPTLTELVKDGPLPAGRAVGYLKTIAEAVQFAHERGILHRDLKPSNVLVDADDRPRVTDFGLAKVMHGDSSLTHTGDVMGSPAYMPPEQAQGKASRVGPASDVYSLGAVLYFLLTGRAPFEGETAVDVLRRVIDEEPVPPSRINAKVPSDLETICLKCLAKDPAQRYASARELVEELNRFLNYEPILAKPAGQLRRVWSWTQKNPWAVAGAFALLLFGMACVAYGFWERLRYADWVRDTGRAMRRAEDNSPGLMFYIYFPLLMVLVHVSRRAFRRAFQQAADTNASPRTGALLGHAVIGAALLLVGLALVFLQTRCWAWKTSPAWLLWFEIPAVLFALILMRFGFQMVWETVGIHETSRFRTLVDKSVEAELRIESNLWPVWKTMLFALCCVCLLVVGAMLVGMFFSTRERVAFGWSKFGPMISLGAGAWISWAVHRRRRLLTNVFAPGAVLFVAALVLAFDTRAEIVPMVLALTGIAFVSTASIFIFLTKPGAHNTVARRFPGSVKLDVLKGVGVFAVVLLAFHLVENWRGARAWNQVKAQAEARGQSLDFASYLKPRVPDEQNVMEHPFMKAHFIKGNPGPGIEHPPYSKPVLTDAPCTLDELKKLPRQNDDTKLPSALVGAQASRKIFPDFEIRDTPLHAAIYGLAREAGLKSSMFTNPISGKSDRAASGPDKYLFRTINITFTNLTAIEALDQLARGCQLTVDEAAWRRDGDLRMVKQSQPTVQGVIDWYQLNFAREFAQIEEALARPLSQMQPNARLPEESQIPNFVAARTCAQAYASLCKAHLLLGQTDAALRDLRMLRRLTDAVQANEPPNLVESMIRVSLTGLLASTVEETMADGLWPTAHILEIQKLCGGTDLFSSFVLSMYGSETAGMLQVLDVHARHDRTQFYFGDKFGFGSQNDFARDLPSFARMPIRLLIPAGWVDQNKAHYARIMQEGYASIDPVKQQVNSRAFGEWSGGLMARLDSAFQPYAVFSSIAIPNYSKAGRTLARNQTQINLAHLACALERHRAAKGSYPETPAALVPEFTVKLPHDVMDGQPLRYRRTADGKYLLYSLGWDAKDDGGRVKLGKNNQPDRDTSPDWVWLGVPTK